MIERYKATLELIAEYKDSTANELVLELCESLEKIWKDVPVLKKRDKIEIWTDGSCDNIGSKKGGWAFIVVKNNEKLFESLGSESNTTNNRMELTAILKGLESIEKLDLPDNLQIEIKSDSAYSLNIWKENWIYNWKKTNWKGGSVKNLDLIKAIDDIQRQYQIIWTHVKGHSGIEWNERADELAMHAYLNLL